MKPEPRTRLINISNLTEKHVGLKLRRSENYNLPTLIIYNLKNKTIRSELFYIPFNLEDSNLTQKALRKCNRVGLVSYNTLPLGCYFSSLNGDLYDFNSVCQLITHILTMIKNINNKIQKHSSSWLMIDKSALLSSIYRYLHNSNNEFSAFLPAKLLYEFFRCCKKVLCSCFSNLARLQFNNFDTHPSTQIILVTNCLKTLLLVITSNIYKVTSKY